MALRVGITGGIGSGKSTVCRIFECLGTPVYYADSRARWLTENHSEIRREVVDLLGKEAYTEEGRYNTDYVSSRVFKDKALLERLNMIIHPRVKEDTRIWAGEHKKHAFIVKEAAIMSRKSGDLDYIVAVVSPESLRIQRVLLRDRKRTLEQVRAIIASQAPEQHYYSIADFVVKNNEEDLLIPQVLHIQEKLLKASSLSGSGRV